MRKWPDIMWYISLLHCGTLVWFVEMEPHINALMNGWIRYEFSLAKPDQRSSTSMSTRASHCYVGHSLIIMWNGGVPLSFLLVFWPDVVHWGWIYNWPIAFKLHVNRHGDMLFVMISCLKDWGTPQGTSPEPLFLHKRRSAMWLPLSFT